MASIQAQENKSGTYYYLAEKVDGKVVKTYLGTKRPRCLTLETLWFKAGVLVPTINFSQGKDSGVYHDCSRGSAGTCRLFSNCGVLTSFSAKCRQTGSSPTLH